MTYGIDELANYIGTNFISETYRAAKIFKQLELTAVEMALIKALSVLFTGMCIFNILVFLPV